MISRTRKLNENRAKPESHAKKHRNAFEQQREERSSCHTRYMATHGHCQCNSLTADPPSISMISNKAGRYLGVLDLKKLKATAAAAAPAASSVPSRSVVTVTTTLGAAETDHYHLPKISVLWYWCKSCCYYHYHHNITILYVFTYPTTRTVSSTQHQSRTEEIG